MTGLPQGWASQSLGELGVWSGGGTPSKAVPEYWANGDIPWVSPKDMKVRKISASQDKITEAAVQGSAAQLIAEGSVLIVTRSGILAHSVPVALTSVPVTVNQDIKAITPCTAIDPDFLLAALEASRDTILGKCRKAGTTVESLDTERLKALPIPLPPLPEQRRIVRKFDTLSTRSTTARKHLTAIEKLVERCKRAVLGQFFPDDLPTEPLGESCAKIGSGATPRGGKNVYLPEGTPFIRSQNVRFEGFDWDGLAFISDEHSDELRNVAVQTGDVLLNITGASIGRVCLAPAEMDGARVNQHVSIIRTIPQKLDAGFVQYFLSSPAIQNWIWNENYGVTRQALTKGMIEQISIPDISLDQQREIVRRIEIAFTKIDRLAAEAAKALKLLGHLDQRILAKAFSGELVPQDPNDEPAEVLLARIKAERAAEPKAKRGRKRTNA